MAFVDVVVEPSRASRKILFLPCLLLDSTEAAHIASRSEKSIGNSV